MAIPTVSVILPVRDGEATVEAAIRSMLTQSVTGLEVLVVEDGSKDGTALIVRRLAREDPRIQVLQTPGLGLVGACNLALSHSRAPYVARMDADDVSQQTRLERSLATLMASSELAGVGTGVEIFRDDRPPSPNLVAYGKWLSSLTTPERLFEERLVESPLCHPSVTLRREVVVQAGGWRDGDFPEDWELWLRLLEAGQRLCCVGEVLHRWRDHDARLTRVDARYRRASHLALKARVIARRFGEQRLIVCGAGETGVALARLLVELGATVEQLVDLNPRKVGQRIHGALVVRPEDVGGPRAGVHALAAVGAKGGRAELRAWLTGSGWLEGRDFTCVA